MTTRHTSSQVDGRGGNPFSTRYLRPGRLPPLDGSGRPLDLEHLAATFLSRGGSAAIVGPHGSGKTTLLGHLADTLESMGERVIRMRMRERSDLLRLLASIGRGPRGIVCVDSWERIGWPANGLVRVVAAGARVRLLVTAHRPGAMPTLWRCATSPRVTEALVERLLDGSSPPAIGREAIEEAHRRAGGDVREALFLLYDRFEEAARGAGRGRWPLARS